MINLQQYIQQREEEFEKKFVIKSHAGTGLLRYTDADKIKSFHAATIQGVLKKVVEMVEKNKNPYSDLDMVSYREGYGHALYDFSEQIKSITKIK